MNPNKEFHKKPAKSIRVRDPEECRQDALDMLAEMGICRKCHDHKPCGCEPMGKCPNCLTENFDLDDRVCYSCDFDEKQDPNSNLSDDGVGRVIGITIRRGCINCGTPTTGVGGFCSTKCQGVYVGEA